MIKPAFRQQAESNNTTSKNVRSIHTITCDICDASYMPSQSRQDLLQASPSVLESTFMSMCHYCFRCRQPACPQCWDAIHGVCGACVQEAHLPFRSSATPLKGILFPPFNSPMSPMSHLGQSAMGTTIAPLLICIRPGSFQQRTSTFESANSTTTTATTATIATIATTATTTTAAMVPATPSKWYQPDSIKEQQTTSVKKTQPAVVLRSEEIIATAQEAEDVLLRTWTNIFKTIECVLNVILLGVLLFVLVLMLLAELSAGANAQILQLFHVDIRSEMAYLLYVIQQIHV